MAVGTRLNIEDIYLPCISMSKVIYTNLVIKFKTKYLVQFFNFKFFFFSNKRRNHKNLYIFCYVWILSETLWCPVHYNYFFFQLQVPCCDFNFSKKKNKKYTACLLCHDMILIWVSFFKIVALYLRRDN